MLSYRIGNGFDVHRLEAGLPLWLGGILVPHTHGLVAHSDGDVLLHSLADALLGAMALGDIGAHFPDTDPAYKGADSKVLLARCCELVHDKGYVVDNVDCTVLAQRPKLRPYVDQMREVIAGIMAIDISQVSIKATTTERLGFTGREEGIAVYSTALMSRAN